MCITDRSLHIFQRFPDCKSMLFALSANSFVLTAKQLLMTSFFLKLPLQELQWILLLQGHKISVFKDCLNL